MSAAAHADESVFSAALSILTIAAVRWDADFKNIVITRVTRTILAARPSCRKYDIIARRECVRTSLMPAHWAATNTLSVSARRRLLIIITNIISIFSFGHARYGHASLRRHWRVPMLPDERRHINFRSRRWQERAAGWLVSAGAGAAIPVRSNVLAAPAWLGAVVHDDGAMRAGRCAREPPIPSRRALARRMPHHARYGL